MHNPPTENGMIETKEDARNKNRYGENLPLKPKA
jgi:hypothetical protein